VGGGHLSSGLGWAVAYSTTEGNKRLVKGKRGKYTRAQKPDQMATLEEDVGVRQEQFRTDTGGGEVSGGQVGQKKEKYGGEDTRSYFELFRPAAWFTE